MLKVFSISLPPRETFGDFFFLLRRLSLSHREISLALFLSRSSSLGRLIDCSVTSKLGSSIVRFNAASLLHRCLASPSQPRFSIAASRLGIRCVCGIESCCGDDDQDNGEGIEGDGVIANCVAPGQTATEFFFAGKTEETVKRLADACLMGRIGQTSDIAPVVGFVASDAGEWINGQVIMVNGGVVIA
ncbi:hypothetical protein Scep_010054 [Stephania cephalantha]|uniref:Uncharacterized protein n=1 Tax=Stephania cephalantha TaxID=152367 RepID=A0AAP0JVN8_9MAGN